MEKLFADFVHGIAQNIIAYNSLMIEAYNAYQESEHDGVDYLFNINVQEDLECCVRGGMTAEQIVKIYNEYNSSKEVSPYFMFGVNHEDPHALKYTHLEAIMKSRIEDVIANVIAYPCANDTYKELYGKCVTDFMRGYKLV